MQKLKEAIPMLIPLFLMFYYIYPQALGIAGSSFVSLAGIIGVGLYAYHRFPFWEVIAVIAGFLILLFVFYTSGYINSTSDPYTFGYIKTQIAWFFSAYVVMLAIFQIHKRPSFTTVLLYIAASSALQALIAFGMNVNEGVNSFFYSIQMQGLYTEEVMEEGSAQRLMGYGIGFFGAGAYSGFSLIVLSYILMRMRMDRKTFILFAVMYAFIFYIGLFMARTTVIGMAVGLVLIAILYIWDRRAERGQIKTFFIASIFFMIGGYIFATFYFPYFTNWAFELFTNFIERGELTTNSSSGLEEMFVIPEDLDVLLWGTGRMVFMGTDVGFSRMLYWVGVPGTLAFYLLPLMILKLCFTKDWAVNILGLMVYVYTLALNIKGWIDMNFVMFLIFFYFIFYKYFVYLPKQKSSLTSIAAIRKYGYRKDKLKK